MGGRFMQILATTVSLSCLISCSHNDPTGGDQPEYGLQVLATGNGTGAISSSPAGVACSYSGTAVSGTCSASFASGTVVTLTANPAGGHTFAGWSGACTGTGGCQVTMSQVQSVTATFTAPIPTYQLAVTGGGTGSGSVTSSPGAITCTITAGTGTGACTASFNSGTVVTLTATAVAGHTFAGWSGACTGTGSCQVTMSQARSVTATFTPPIPTFQLAVTGGGTGNGSVTSSPIGINCAIIGGVGTGACTASFNSGTVVTLTAAAAAGHSFAGWSGACTGTGSCQVTMGQAQSVTATFTAPIPTFQLAVTGATGNGSVTSSPTGISCAIIGGVGTGACTASFNSGTVVTLTATAGSGHTFGGWSGACNGTGDCQVTMSQARSVTATFTPVYPLSVTGGGTGNGSVTSTPGAITCTISAGGASGTCNASFNSGTLVALTATAASGHTFAGWSGGCNGTGNCQVTMSQARSVTATFTALVPSQHIAVPAYFSNWSGLLPYVPTANVIVVNPGNGPVGPDYSSQISQAKSKGAQVYGYVYTKYANTKLDSLRNPKGAFDRMVDSVKADINEYYRRYPTTLAGIFLDEVTSDCANVGSYYKPIADYIRSRGGKVILNPGGPVPTCYRDIADIVVTFEGTFDSYKNAWSTAGRDWETNAYSARIWHIVHTTTSSTDLSAALALSRSRSAGYIYVTSLTAADNTFGALPVYFGTEATNVKAYGGISP